MHARAEGEVAVGLARCIEAIGLGKLGRIAIGGTDADMDVGAGSELLAADLEVGCKTSIAELVRTLEAQAFLDTALISKSGFSFSRRSSSGKRSSASTVLPMRFVVVSWPAFRRKIQFCTSSSCVSRSPSTSPWISTPNTSRSSAGRFRRLAISSSR
jgi:hypothetical protein